MKKLASAVAAALMVVAASSSEARMVLRCLPGHENGPSTGAAPLLRDLPASAWILVNGTKTRPATIPYVVGDNATSDRAALALLFGLPDDFRPSMVRFARLSEFSRIASRTPTLSPAQECDSEAVLPDSLVSRQTIVMGEHVFGRAPAGSQLIMR